MIVALDQDYEKFDKKKVKVAGARVRNNLLNIKKLCDILRKQVLVQIKDLPIKHRPSSSDDEEKEEKKEETKDDEKEEKKEEMPPTEREMMEEAGELKPKITKITKKERKPRKANKKKEPLIIKV